MKTHTNKVAHELAEPIQNLVEDARDLLAATAHVAEGKVVEARHRLSVAMEKSRETLREVQRSALAGARATDRVIRAHPYHSIGVAFSVGIALGLIMRRRM